MQKNSGRWKISELGGRNNVYNVQYLRYVHEGGQRRLVWWKPWEESRETEREKRKGGRKKRRVKKVKRESILHVSGRAVWPPETSPETYSSTHTIGYRLRLPVYLPGTQTPETASKLRWTLPLSLPYTHRHTHIYTNTHRPEASTSVPRMTSETVDPRNKVLQFIWDTAVCRWMSAC